MQGVKLYEVIKVFFIREKSSRLARKDNRWNHYIRVKMQCQSKNVVYKKFRFITGRYC